MKCLILVFISFCFFQAFSQSERNIQDVAMERVMEYVKFFKDNKSYNSLSYEGIELQIIDNKIYTDNKKTPTLFSGSIMLANYIEPWYGGTDKTKFVLKKKLGTYKPWLDGKTIQEWQTNLLEQIGSIDFLNNISTAYIVDSSNLHYLNSYFNKDFIYRHGSDFSYESLIDDYGRSSEMCSELFGDKISRSEKLVIDDANDIYYALIEFKEGLPTGEILLMNEFNLVKLRANVFDHSLDVYNILDQSISLSIRRKENNQIEVKAFDHGLCFAEYSFQNKIGRYPFTGWIKDAQGIVRFELQKNEGVEEAFIYSTDGFLEYSFSHSRNNDKIIVREFEEDDRYIEGGAIEKYTEYQNDAKNGLEIIYGDSGVPREIFTYKNDTLNGPYYELGYGVGISIKLAGFYADGLKHGDWTYFTTIELEDILPNDSDGWDSWFTEGYYYEENAIRKISDFTIKLFPVLRSTGSEIKNIVKTEKWNYGIKE